MLKGLNILLLTGFLTACTWSDLIGMVTPSSGGGIDTELVIGDKSQEVNTEIGAETTNQQAESIVNNIVNEQPVGWIIFAMICLILPTPQSMWKAWRSKDVKR